MTIKIPDFDGLPVDVPEPNANGRAAAAASRPFAIDNEAFQRLADIITGLAPLATQATLSAVDTKLGTISSTLQAQVDFEESIWVDDTNTFFVRRVVIDQDLGTAVVTYTTPAGGVATPGAGVRPAANEESLQTETVRFTGRVAGTGYSVGDHIQRTVIWNVNTNPATIQTTAWLNLTTGLIMATPPTIANLDLAPSALPANAMTETTGAAILAKMIASPASAANQALEVAALGAPDDIAGQSTIMGQLKALNVAASDVTTPLPVKGQAPLVRIAPTLQTSAYTAGTVLFATTAIANLAPSNDQGVVLESLFVVDKDDEGAAITLHFFSSNVALGTLGSAPSLSDADAASSWLGSVDIVTGDYKDLGGVKVASLKGIGLNLQPGSGARTVWVGGIAVGTPTFAGTTDLTLGFGALG